MSATAIDRARAAFVTRADVQRRVDIMRSKARALQRRADEMEADQRTRDEADQRAAALRLIEEEDEI